ncbi:MAG: ABC transporter permease, partial [Rhodospirillales bacterium]|nr:ABC transporter permease [Rhodospirillales bacterium]
MTGAALAAAPASSLAAAVRRATRTQRLWALLLVAPLLLLLLLSFCLPIAALLGRAVYDPTMADALPRTARALRASPGDGVPNDAAFAALGEDLLAARQTNGVYAVGKALNALLPGARSHVLHAGRHIHAGETLTRAALVAEDPFWGRTDTWFAIRRG